MTYILQGNNIEQLDGVEYQERLQSKLLNLEKTMKFLEEPYDYDEIEKDYQSKGYTLLDAKIEYLVVKLYNVLKSIGIDAELDIKQPYSWLFSVYKSGILFDEQFDRLVNVIKRNNFNLSLTLEQFNEISKRKLRPEQGNEKFYSF